MQGLQTAGTWAAAITQTADRSTEYCRYGGSNLRQRSIAYFSYQVTVVIAPQVDGMHTIAAYHLLGVALQSIGI